MSSEMTMQVLAAISGVGFALCGAVLAYVSYLGMKDKIKPNPVMGVRLNFSRNYKLYQQEKYWYPLNRYGGERMFYVAVAWTLLNLAIAVLPIDPQTKVMALGVLMILVTVVILVIAWQIVRYADRLVSADPAYR
jgi:hypothetical protein